MFLLPVHFCALVRVPRIWALERLLLLLQPLNYRVNKCFGHYWKQTDPLDLSQNKVGSKREKPHQLVTLQATVGREAFSAVTWRQGCIALMDNLMSFNQMGVKKL